MLTLPLPQSPAHSPTLALSPINLLLSFSPSVIFFHFAECFMAGHNQSMVVNTPDPLWTRVSDPIKTTIKEALGGCVQKTTITTMPSGIVTL